MSIKIAEYQNDSSKLQANVSYKVGNRLVNKRWLIPIAVYSHLSPGKKEKACETWAQNKLVQVLQEENKGEITKITTLDQFNEKWLQWLGQNVKPATVDNYARAYNNHIKPFWGKKGLVELSNGSLMIDYITYLDSKTRGKVGNRGKNLTVDFVGKDKKLAVSSKNNIQAALGSICELAHYLAMIPYRPKIKFESREKADISDKKYTLEQQEIILKCARKIDLRMYAAVLLGLDCGLRRGEALALSWNSVGKNSINVKYNLNVIKGIAKIGSTKGGLAVEVAMSSRAIEALQDIRPENASGRIFDGLMPWGLNAWTRKILEKANKKDSTIVVSANFHKFRHNCASNLADRDYYIVKIKDHLRHKSLDTTLLYVHTGSIDETKNMLDSIGLPEKKEKLKLVK